MHRVKGNLEEIADGNLSRQSSMDHIKHLFSRLNISCSVLANKEVIKV